MIANTLDTYNDEIPPINGILWQALLNNIPLRRPWDTLGVGKTLIQWIAVDGYSFVPNPWIPTYNIHLDMDDLASHPFASEIILGTPGYFSEVTSRNSLPLMADLAAKFATMDWPDAVKGYYFPVEIDPTWADAHEKLGVVWDLLPRPLYISAYYGEGIDGEEAAIWLKSLIPPDVNLLFQDGCGAFNVPIALAKERLKQLEHHLGKERVQLIAEVFKPNPNWDGTPGEYFLPLTADEYRYRIGSYTEIYNEGRLWVFDGPNYISNPLIDQLQHRPSLAVPTNLAAKLAFDDDIRLYSSFDDVGPEHGRKYTVYDSSGNNVLREYYSHPGERWARYPKVDMVEDYGFTPTYVVFDVMSIRSKRYNSDRSELFASNVVLDDSIVTSTVARSTWGDVGIKAWPLDAKPHNFIYYFDIFHPTRRDEVMRVIEVDGATVVDGLIRADYSNELNVPDAVAAFNGSPEVWGYLKWNIRSKPKVSAKPPELIGIYENFVLEDNKAFVKKVVLMGINSLVGGMFNDLSDPLNPGGTGVPGRKDVVAAHTWRETYAEVTGLRPIEVMPVMTVVGSSPINPMPYQQGFDLNNFWWDATTNSPGPNLIIADGIVKALKTVPDYFIESGPGETTGLSYAPEEQRPAILTAWRTSNIAMLAWMRANWGNPNLEIWFHSATTSWWGHGVPVDVNAECTALVRELQQSMSLEGIGFKFATYVPDSNKYSGYKNEMVEGLGWVHYSLDVYHSLSEDSARAMGTNTNRALDPPAWTTLGIIKGFEARTMPNEDIKCSWTARPEATGWKYKNKRGDTKEIISEGMVTTPEFTFTRAEQVEAYDFPTNYIVCEVAEYIVESNDDGPSKEFNETAIPRDIPLAPTGLKAHQETNLDVTMTWDARPTATAWYFRNLRADNGNVISEGVKYLPRNVFTEAQQRAAYNYTVGYVIFEVQEFDEVNNIKGPATQFNGSAST